MREVRDLLLVIVVLVVLGLTPYFLGSLQTVVMEPMTVGLPKVQEPAPR